jgi:hypothetical protein
MQENSIIWKPVVGYEGLYEVSNEGDVMSLRRKATDRRGRVRDVPSRKLTPHLNRGGYCMVLLSKNGHANLRSVHRLLMMAFFPRDDHASVVINHKDGNKANNQLSNLEWCKHSENIAHAYRTLKVAHPWAGRCGKRHHGSKAVIGTHTVTGEIVEYESASMAASAIGAQNSKILRAAHGKQKTASGYQWRFA